MILKATLGSTSLEAAALWCRSKGKVVGLTSGSFDLMHDFHLRFLKQCRRQCDYLVVGVDSNRHVQERKGPDRPILSEWQRVMLVNALKYVDFAYIQDGIADLVLVAESLPVQVVFRNQEFAGRESEVAVGTSGAKVVIIRDVTEMDSTSALVRRIRGEKT